MKIIPSSFSFSSSYLLLYQLPKKRDEAILIINQ
jgi:hypothetical protein